MPSKPVLRSERRADKTQLRKEEARDIENDKTYVLERIVLMIVLPLVYCGVYPYIVYAYFLDSEGSSGSLAAFWTGTVVMLIAAGLLMYLAVKVTSSIYNETNQFPMRLYLGAIGLIIVGTAVLTATRVDGGSCPQ